MAAIGELDVSLTPIYENVATAKGIDSRVARMSKDLENERVWKFEDICIGLSN